MKKITCRLTAFFAALSLSSSAAAFWHSSLPNGGGDFYDDRAQYEKVCAWAQALADRDGLARYRMMTGDMQRQFVENQKEYTGGEDWNFVIGYSSPQTVGFEIVSLGDTAIITYHQTDSTGEVYTVCEKLTFTGEKNSRLVSSCESLQ